MDMVNETISTCHPIAVFASLDERVKESKHAVVKESVAFDGVR